MKKHYTVLKTKLCEKDLIKWDSTPWHHLNTAEISEFHPRSTTHHPRTFVKIGYDEKAVFILFKVLDDYVRAINTEYNSKVHEDSCVEWFIKPYQAEGYFNFEMNACGTLHVNYIIDPERDETGKRKNIQPVPENHAKMIKISTSMTGVIDPEIKAETTWYLGMIIPFDFFKLYTPINKINGSIWQGNLYKCGDKTSHPHWGCWSRVETLNFHQPKHFGEFLFSAKSDDRL